MNRIDIEERLNDHADGQLAGEPLRELETWLEAHPDDRDRLEKLRALKRAAGALDRRVDPPRDLWPGIRAEIEQQTAATPGVRAVPRPGDELHASARPRATRLPWWGALAASLIVGLGGTWLALQLRSGAGDAGDVTVPRVTTNLPDASAPGTEAGANDTMVTTGPVATSDLALASGVGGSRMDADLAAAEEAFERATEQLMNALQARRTQMDPQTLEFIESNLAVINNAIKEVRSALDVEPGNPARGHALAALYKQRMQLLWTASSLTTEL